MPAPMEIRRIHRSPHDDQGVGGTAADAPEIVKVRHDGYGGQKIIGRVGAGGKFNADDIVENLNPSQDARLLGNAGKREASISMH